MEKLQQTPSQTIGPFFAYSLTAQQYGYNFNSIVNGSLVNDAAEGEQIFITGNIFEAYGGQTAFYFSLVPIGILIICLFFFNRIQKKSEAKIEFSSKGGH